MKVLKAAFLGMTMVLSITSYAQDKEKETKKNANLGSELIDSGVEGKLRNGERESVKEYLPGYYYRKEDDHSFAKRNEAIVTHLDLSITIDFEKQQIRGSASYKVKWFSGNEIIFDSKNLDIEDVKVDGRSVDFTKLESDPLLGTPIVVPIIESSKIVRIDYSTRAESEALQWLSPKQADSGLPFVYTQGEAILTRSWIPIQDSPAIKMTYTAKVSVPADYSVVMSGKRLVDLPDQGKFEFTMDHAIPAYLIAMATGEIAYKDVNDMIRIYALPQVVDAAAEEFRSTPKMMEVAEQIAGEYVWDRYDMIVLPRAFPFGGMENPMLTFLTPTIIAGDGSLVSLIAHELAHSWSGNLVTNGAWDDFWLNEGITVYLERRIMEGVEGKPTADMMRYNGYNDLLKTMADLDDQDKWLKLDLINRNPDDGMTDVAYEKGALFMEYIESLVGREAMDAMLKTYFGHFKYGKIDTENFIRFIEGQFPGRLSDDVVNKVVYGIALPKVDIEKPKEFLKVDEVISGMLKKGEFPTRYFDEISVQEWVYMLDEMIRLEVGTEAVVALSEFRDMMPKNTEIVSRWYELSIRNHHDDELKSIYDFVSRVGRRKFLMPLYTALNSRSDLTKQTMKAYVAARGNYHSISQHSLDKLFNLSEKDIRYLESKMDASLK